jgi:hypothetical protein
MKTLFLALILSMSSFFTAKAQIIVPDSIAPCMSFVDKQDLSAKDYILSLFDRARMIIKKLE